MALIGKTDNRNKTGQWRRGTEFGTTEHILMATYYTEGTDYKRSLHPLRDTRARKACMHARENRLPRGIST